MRFRRAAAGFALLPAALVPAACADGGSDGDPAATTTTGRPVTSEEAGVLASVLVRNLEDQGATFAVDLQLVGTPVRFEGQVDWVGHAGRGTVTFGGFPPYEVVWTTDAVLQALPGLRERAGVDWVVHPANPQGSRLDAIVAIVTGLASTTPDNPVNLQQREDVDFLRQDELDGVPIDVYASGDLVLWIGADDERLYRLEAPLAFADAPATIDLTDRGPVEVLLPGPDDAVEAGSIPDDYAELVTVGVL